MRMKIVSSIILGLMLISTVLALSFGPTVIRADIQKDTEFCQLMYIKSATPVTFHSKFEGDVEFVEISYPVGVVKSIDGGVYNKYHVCWNFAEDGYKKGILYVTPQSNGNVQLRGGVWLIFK